jgi:hypothetical protein
LPQPPLLPVVTLEAELSPAHLSAGGCAHIQALQPQAPAAAHTGQSGSAAAASPKLCGTMAVPCPAAAVRRRAAPRRAGRPPPHPPPRSPSAGRRSGSRSAGMAVAGPRGWPGARRWPPWPRAPQPLTWAPQRST